MKPAATLNCDMALTFARWTKNELVPSARYRYFSGVKTIHQGSSYSCRNIAGTHATSEHGKGNALDVMRIELEQRQATSTCASRAGSPSASAAFSTRCAPTAASISRPCSGLATITTTATTSISTSSRAATATAPAADRKRSDCHAPGVPRVDAATWLGARRANSAPPQEEAARAVARRSPASDRALPRRAAYLVAPEFWTWFVTTIIRLDASMLTTTPQGIPGDPINVGLVGTRAGGPPRLSPPPAGIRPTPSR